MTSSRARTRQCPALVLAVAVLLLQLARPPILHAGNDELPPRDFTDQASHKVTRVIDGDTLELAMGGHKVKVRLVGIDTPEYGQRGRPAEPYAQQATEALRKLCENAAVYLEYDPLCARQDRYGRTLGHLFRASDGLWLNLETVRLGLSETYDKYPFAHAELFRAYEAEAREAGRGKWAKHAPASPRVEPNGAAGDPEVFYVTATGRAYHRQGCPTLVRGSIAATPEQVRARRLRPCGKCRP